EHDRVGVLTFGVEVLTHRGRDGGAWHRLWTLVSWPSFQVLQEPRAQSRKPRRTIIHPWSFSPSTPRRLRAAVPSRSTASSCGKRPVTCRFHPPRVCRST